MAGAIYGNDFSSLQGGIANDAALRQRGLESALQNALGSLSQMRQRQILGDQFTRSLAANAAHLDAEKEHWKDIARQHGDELELRTSAEDRQGRYYDWLMKQEPTVKTRDRELDEKFLIDLSKQGQILDDEEAKKLAPNASDTVRNIAVRQAKAVQSTQEADFNRAHALVGALNTEADLKEKIASAKKGDAARWFGGVRSANPLIDQYQAQLDSLNKTIAPYRAAPGVIERYTQPSLTAPGRFEPAVETPYHLIKRRDQTSTSTGTNPDTVLPATTVPNRRSYGLRPGGQPAPEDNPRAPMIDREVKIAPSENAPATATGTSGKLTRVQSPGGVVWKVPIEAVPMLIRDRNARWLDAPTEQAFPEMPMMRAPQGARQ